MAQALAVEADMLAQEAPIVRMHLLDVNTAGPTWQALAALEEQGRSILRQPQHSEDALRDFRATCEKFAKPDDVKARLTEYFERYAKLLEMRKDLLQNVNDLQDLYVCLRTEVWKRSPPDAT